jgi:hypothetical protein
VVSPADLYDRNLGFLDRMSIIRPYIYSLLPENMIKSGSFIVDIVYVVCND